MNKQILFLITQFFLLLFGLAVVVYGISIVLPGNAQEMLAGMDNNNLIVQKETFTTYVYSFFSWLWSLIRLDLGKSVYLDIPIIDLILSHWGITIFLNGISWVIALFLSIYLVKILFKYQHIRYVKNTYVVLETILLSFTPLTLSLIILSSIVFFNIPLPLFYTTYSNSFEGMMRYIAPLIVLIMFQVPLYVRSLLKSVNIISKLPYIHFSYSLGYSQSQIWKNDILPNALLYTISLSSVQISLLMGGSILIEFNFAIPGLGTLLINAVSSRDVLLMNNIVFLYGMIVGTVHIGLKLLHKRYYTAISYEEH